MNITLKQAEKLMYPLLNNKIVPFLHSSPALGKSSLAKTVAAKAKLKVIDLRLTELDASDLNGLPYFNEGKAQYLPFNTFPIQDTEVPDGYNGWLLLLDELNSALPSVQSAAYKLILDRQVGQYKLHDDVYIIACGNLDTDNAITYPLSSALVSRFAHFYIEPNTKEWTDWALDNDIDIRIISFLGFMPSHLYKFNPDSTEPYASPRTWEMLSKALSELEHRYFKVMKLAGVYAFIDQQDEISPQHIEYAIKLAEDSGQAFVRLMTPQRPYIKLANYLAQTKTQVTLADLDEDLPSFRGSKAQKDEQIMMAIAWGYKNNIVIKKSFTDSILFLHADTIQETNLDNLIVSYTNSPDMTSDYFNDTVSIENLSQLVQMADFHWLSHHVEHGYRKEENAIAGFNLLVLDVDSSTKLTTAMMLLKKYTAIYYTTKRHQENGEDRYRIILPLNYTLKLDSKEYKELYNNVINSLPFEVDAQCGQRAKKWLTNPNAQVHTVEGELFDILPFIPKTSKNEEREKLLQDQSQMDNLERWVINNTGDGNRNNMLLRFAMILVDAGFSFDSIKDKVISLNNKMADKLDEIELYNTIFHSVAAKLTSIA